ncbi:MAG: NERD domain-containing protein [Acidimicrobiales bacterium]|nr:NERD domain-containing protein [Acidimicrobiales bacterium]
MVVAVGVGLIAAGGPGSRLEMVTMAMVVLAVVAPAVLVAGRAGRGIDRWLRGAAAEEATARVLERLPPRKWTVWHDLRVPGSRANIDHVAIGPTGVWLVDTKSTRAPVRATRWSVRFGDRRLDTTATRWEAGVLGDRLGVPTRPIVAVHGPGMRRRGGRAQGVPAVPVDRLLRRLRRGRRRLAGADIEALAGLVEAEFEAAERPRLHG